MHTDTRKWILYQLKGLFCIMALSIALAFGSNILRKQPVQLIEKRRLLKAGDPVPFVPLTKDGLLPYQEYLKLPPGKEIMTFWDIQTDLLVAEVFNVFCFPCQTHVLTLNKVYDTIENSPELKGRIKIFGIAFGNRKGVVEDFMRDFDVRFPVVPDTNLRAEKIIGPGIHTPFSLFIRPDKTGKLGIIAATHNGAIENPEVLLDALVKLLNTPPGQIDDHGLLFSKGDQPEGQP